MQGQYMGNQQPPNPGMQAHVFKNPVIAKADAYKNEIQLMKMEAVKNDQYMQANRLKQAYNKISDLQNALEQLEIKKAVAIEREDYVVAQTIKESIDQIQHILEMPINDLICILNNEELPKKQ